MIDADVQTTWKRIETAASNGQFVPVIGFDVAASIDYADAVPQGDFCDDVDYEPSFQFREEQCIGAQLRAVRMRLEALPPEESHWEDATRCYLLPLFDHWGTPSELDPGQFSPELLALQTALARLGARLTQEWAKALGETPRPPGIAWLDHSVSRESTKEFPLYSLRASLDTARELAQLKTPPGSLRSRDTRWMYAKLLRLTKEIIGGWEYFWQTEDDDDFAGRHKNWMLTAGKAIDCGWSVDASYLPKPRGEFSGGIQLGHLVWLEHLLRYTLLSQTRAHRTRADFAFALALDHPGIDIPRLPADPLEIGLLYQRGESPVREVDSLSRLIRHCSVDGDGAPRCPGAFHRALARLTRTYGSKPKPDGSSRAPIMFALGMDLEMERALEQEYDAYQVLLPVWLPKDTRQEQAAPAWGTPVGESATNDRSDDQAGTGPAESRPDKTWLLGAFERGAAGFDVRWSTMDACPDWEQGGPLVIKLFGSPAHDLPPVSEIAGDMANYDAEKRPVHHVVLDEMEMIDSILHCDEIFQLENIYWRFGSSMMFCFGYDAVSWGDRAPYLVVDAIRSKADEVAVWAAEGEDRKLPGVVALTRRDDKFVRSVWERLRVEPIYDEQALKSITGKIVEEASKCK